MWTYTTDMRGLRISAADPDLGSWSFVYDLDGRLTSRIDARGPTMTMSMTYDALDRLETKNAPRPGGGEDFTAYDYDEVRGGFFNIGKLTTELKTFGGTTVGGRLLDHDGEGRIAKERWFVDGVVHTATTGFAPAGEVLWRTYPDGDAVGSAGNPFVYDAQARLDAVPGVVTSTDYAADGQTTQIFYPNGVDTTFLYHVQRRWLIETDTDNASSELLNLVYERDLAGRIGKVASLTRHAERQRRG